MLNTFNTKHYSAYTAACNAACNAAKVKVKVKSILPVPGADCVMSANTADAKGFVRIRVGRTTTYQHRRVYQVSNSIPAEMMKELVVTPSCGRYDCINPEHLIASPKSTLEYKLLSSTTD